MTIYTAITLFFTLAHGLYTHCTLYFLLLFMTYFLIFLSSHSHRKSLTPNEISLHALRKYFYVCDKKTSFLVSIKGSNCTYTNDHLFVRSFIHSFTNENNTDES